MDALDAMEPWGARRYGDPCRDCGFDWSLTPHDALGRIAALPDEYADLLAGRRGDERHPDLGWNAAAYVCHVTDNLRNWAERLAGARLGGVRQVPDFDPDHFARARHYNEASLAGALWSLRHAAAAWVESVSAALTAATVLTHATRGTQTAADIARNNTHDAAHHAWDLHRILTAPPPPDTAEPEPAR